MLLYYVQITLVFFLFFDFWPHPSFHLFYTGFSRNELGRVGTLELIGMLLVNAGQSYTQRNEKLTQYHCA